MEYNDNFSDDNRDKDSISPNSITPLLKDDVKSVLCIDSPHYKGGPIDINIAQNSHLSNFSDIKLWFIFID